jgi:large subunit ribosomal protein L24
MAGMRIRKGDKVLVISGKDRGKSGRVLSVNREKSQTLVEGVNMIKRHTKANPQKNQKGGIIEREAPVHVSNVMFISPDSGKAGRVGYTFLEDGRKVRICKADGPGSR